MHPVFMISDWEIPAYTLCAFLAAAAAIALALPALRRTGLGTVRSEGLLGMMCAAFLIGARLWNAVINPGNFLGTLKWYSLRLTGLSFYGGVLSAGLVLVTALRVWRRPVWEGLDAMTVPGGVAFCIARIGCFLNGCCAGKATSCAFGMVFPSKLAAQQALSEWLPFFPASHAVHPTQLYELFGAAVGLPLAVWLSRCLCLRPGAVFLLYGAWFSAVRLAVLPLRTLTYPDVVRNIFYPLLYLSLTILGIGMAIWRGRATVQNTDPGADC